MTDEPKNMLKIFESLNDLKNAFKLGEKVVPIIQSLSEFMQDIIPLIETINSSISDSTNQMPKATYQINDVTNATELATNEILDLVDLISVYIAEIDKSMKELSDKQEKKSALLDKLKELLINNTECQTLINEFISIDDSVGLLKEVSDRIVKIKDDSYKITLSLQVQDITTQQLSAVNHLIESVNNKLSNIVSEIDKSDIKKEIQSLKIDVPIDAHFDPNARYDPNHQRQDDVDKVISDQKMKQSQEDIDKLFS